MGFGLFGAVLGGCDGGAGDTSDDAGGPTYWADVRPILDETCARCHTEGGQAPISFEDPAVVVALAATIRARIDEGTMPPPAPDPSCADYVDSDMYVLDDAEKDVIHRWIDAGTPLGDEADRPAPPEPRTLAPWDQVVSGAAPYTPQFAEGNPNDYRCWAVEVGNEDEIYLTGLEAIVENPSFVHHVVLFDDGKSLLGGDDGWSGGADPNDADGFPCDGFGQGDWAFMHGWGPGAAPMEFPEGFGMKLQAHAKLVIQAHYFDSGDVGPDNVKYGLNYAPMVDREVYNLPIYPYQFDHIPAGDPDYTASETYGLGDWGVPLTVSVLSVWPHMHLLGKGFDYYVTDQEGNETCLVKMDGWDFHNQVPAQYLTPITIDPTADLTLECHYDNSASNPNQFADPPQDVIFGEGTQDEMCFAFTYAFAGTP